eukprot:6111182-Alexandrium_andersonii.AAC.1
MCIRDRPRRRGGCCDSCRWLALAQGPWRVVLGAHLGACVGHHRPPPEGGCRGRAGGRGRRCPRPPRGGQGAGVARANLAI